MKLWEHPVGSGYTVEAFDYQGMTEKRMREIIALDQKLFIDAPLDGNEMQYILTHPEVFLVTIRNLKQELIAYAAALPSGAVGYYVGESDKDFAPSPTLFYLYLLGVAPEERQRGMSETMMKEVCSIAYERGNTVLGVHAMTQYGFDEILAVHYGGMKLRYFANWFPQKSAHYIEIPLFQE